MVAEEVVVVSAEGAVVSAEVVAVEEVVGVANTAEVDVASTVGVDVVDAAAAAATPSIVGATWAPSRASRASTSRTRTLSRPCKKREAEADFVMVAV